MYVVAIICFVNDLSFQKEPDFTIIIVIGSSF